MNTLSIVLKTVERCNINCTYCYFFNGTDISYKKNPPVIKYDTIEKVADFLNQGSLDLGINALTIILHGGEPLMQQKEHFISLVKCFQEKICHAAVDFQIQTNATLINEKWVEILNLYNIGVGVSIDGPEKYHDKYRIDHKGNGTHSKVIAGIKLLHKYLSHTPSSLTVINPEFEGRIIYKYLVDLGFTEMDFLFPDHTHDNIPPHAISSYTQYLKGIFEQWTHDDDKKVNVRILDTFMNQLVGNPSLIYGLGPDKGKDLPLLCIRSNGDISPTDELMSTEPNTVTFMGKNVSNSNLKDVLNCDIFKEIKIANNVVPEKCKRCCWYGACGSGSLVNRFSKLNRFNNHSVYCETLQEMFMIQASYLIKSGIPQNTITDNLYRRFV